MFRNIGPNNLAGRIRDIIIQPDNASVVCAAAETGGIWITEDGGRWWYSLTDESLETISMSSVAVYWGTSPANRVLYAATGCPFNPVLSHPGENRYSGKGIYVFRPGTGWVLKPAIGSMYISRILADQRNADKIIAACREGLKISLNGGDSWEFLQDPSGRNISGEVSDLIGDTLNPDIIYAMLHEGAIYKITFTAGSSATAHTCLDITPRISDVAVRLNWAKLAIGKNGMHRNNFLLLKETGARLFMSTDGGMVWTNFIYPASDYDNNVREHNSVAVSPVDENIMIAAGVGMYRSERGPLPFANWRIVSIHNDHFRTVFSESDPNIVYTAGDGGIYKSINAGATWTYASYGLVTTQFYKLSGWKQLGSVLGGGTQDQSSFTSSSSLNWFNRYFPGGDPATYLFQHDDPRIQYCCTNAADLIDAMNPSLGRIGIYRRTYLSGERLDWEVLPNTATSSGIIPVQPTLFMHPRNPHILFTSTSRVYRKDISAGAAITAWQQVSQEMNNIVRHMAIAPSNTEYVYAGTDNWFSLSGLSEGSVWRSRNGATLAPDGSIVPWENITRNLPVRTPVTRPVSSVAVDPNNHLRVLLSLGASNTVSSLSNSVYLSDNTDNLLLPDTSVEANNWRNISSNLPNRQVNVLAFHPSESNIFYAGTDVGLYITRNAGRSWELLNQGLPRVCISDLFVDTHLATRPALYVGTYGRGIFRAEIGATAPTEPVVKLLLRDNILDGGYEYPSPSALPNPWEAGQQVHFWESPDLLFDVEPFQSIGAASVDGMTAENFETLRHENPVAMRRNRLYIQLHNRGIHSAHNVQVKVFICDACLALPPFPASLLSGSTTSDPNWRFIGERSTTDAGESLSLEPNRPKIVAIEIPPGSPLLAGVVGHWCMVAFVNSPNDPIPAVGGNLDQFVRNTRHACQKNLQVERADGTEVGCSFMLVINNANQEETGAGEEDVIDIVIEPAQGGKRKIYVLTEALELDASFEKSVGVKKIQINGEDELRAMGLGPGKKITEKDWSALDRSVVYELLAGSRSELKGLLMKAGESKKMYVNIMDKHSFSRHKKSVFKFLQVQKGEIVGGNTLEIHSPFAVAGEKMAMKRMRMILEKVKIHFDHDILFKGRGEFTFSTEIKLNTEPPQLYKCRIPEEGILKISDQEEKNELSLQAQLFDAYVQGESEIHIRIKATEHDLLKPDDELPEFYAIHMAGTAAGQYSKQLDTWTLWYRIEELD